MSEPERGDFDGDDTVTVADFCKQQTGRFGYVAASGIRIDNANVIVLPNSTAVHRVPPVNPYVRVEREGRDLCGMLHGLSDDGLERPQRIVGEKSTNLIIDVGDGCYYVWGCDLEEDLKRQR